MVANIMMIELANIANSGFSAIIRRYLSMVIFILFTIKFSGRFYVFTLCSSFIGNIILITVPSSRRDSFMNIFPP